MFLKKYLFLQGDVLFGEFLFQVFKFFSLIGKFEDVSFFLFEFLGEPLDGVLMLVVELVGILVVLGEYFL